MMGKILSLNISEEKGTIKRPVPSIRINARGIEKDAHSGDWHRQISLLSQEKIDEFSRQYDREFKPGEFAENLTIEGIDTTTVMVGDKFRAGPVTLEVTQLGKKCHGGDCAVFRAVGKCVMPKEGIFMRVVSDGKINIGDDIEFVPRTMKVGVVTVSDRASAGEYEDKSGPAVEDVLRETLAMDSSRLEISRKICPDEVLELNAALEGLVKDGVDAIFTTGGTGIGPRDITPEVVRPMLSKEIPGIMEWIRVKYGANIPTAVLSRSVAGVTTEGILIYTLPGSVKAVKEYMNEILATLEHAMLMVKGGGH